MLSPTMEWINIISIPNTEDSNFRSKEHPPTKFQNKQHPLLQIPKEPSSQHLQQTLGSRTNKNTQMRGRRGKSTCREPSKEGFVTLSSAIWLRVKMNTKMEKANRRKMKAGMEKREGLARNRDLAEGWK